MTAKEDSDLVEEVLNQVIQNNKDYEDGDILIDWVVVAYVTNPDAEKRSLYPMLCSNGELPHYRVIGLLNTGLEMVTPLEDS